MCQSEIKAFYGFYWEIKASVARYEVIHNKIPADLLNELRNAFDHVARCYCLYGLESEETQDDSVAKHLTLARNHLERLHLDLYKNSLLHLQDRVLGWRDVIERQIQLIGEYPYPLPEVVKFQEEFHEKRIVAETILTNAKQQECYQENHCDKIDLLKNAELELNHLNQWTNQRFYQILPLLEEASQIAKKDRRRYRLSTFVFPAVFSIVGAILGLLLGKFSSW